MTSRDIHHLAESHLAAYHFSKLMMISAILILQAGCNTDPMPHQQESPQERVIMVQASCGQCQFGMDGDGCDLAIRLGEKSYFVDGSGIDDHGDAHHENGLCNCVRNAEVSGKIIDGRFKVTQFELLPTQD